MPKKSASHVRGLHKHHSRTCTKSGSRPTACACPWYGHYQGIQKGLATWAGREVDPRTTGPAVAVLTRLKASVDNGTYNAEGERLSLGSQQRFADFVAEWTTHYAKEHGLTSTSLEPMLNVLKEGLGRFTLEQLAGDPLRIERWLNCAKKERGWSDNTWNRYYELLNSLFNRAVKWRVNNIPRMRANPLASIDKRPGSTVKFETRIEEDVEDRLLRACDQLNRPQHAPHSKRLTWEIVAILRQRAAAGESQKALAAEFKISTGLCCQIIKGQIWNPDRYRIGAKGTEMRRRLYAAFDLGLRASEIAAIQLKHIDFKSVTVKVDGRQRHIFVISLPATMTKGGKTTGEIEHVYAGSDRLRRELIKRRFQLRRDPDAFVFGTEDGRRVQSFRRMWRELFRLAGIDFGRRKGLTWHTIRHEFISRTIENTGDPVVTQKLARHKDGRTTQRYLHARDSHLLEAAVRLNRR
jgi:integrase